MLAASLITFREGLEAALIVGIVLGYLRKIGLSDRRGYVWGGVITAVIASLGVALGLQLIGAQFTGRGEEIFEGTAIFLATSVLTYMIFWMRYQGRFLKAALERDVQLAVSAGQNWVLASLAFIAVFREGVETGLFLSAAAFVTAAGETLWGGLFGVSGGHRGRLVRLRHRRPPRCQAFLRRDEHRASPLRGRPAGPRRPRVPGGGAITCCDRARLGY